MPASLPLLLSLLYVVLGEDAASTTTAPSPADAASAPLGCAPAGSPWSPSWPPACLTAAIEARIERARGAAVWAVAQPASADGAERRFSSLSSLYHAVLGAASPPEAWTARASARWATEPATEAAVFSAAAASAAMSAAELRESAELLAGLPAPRGGEASKRRCLNVGAGIGREAAAVLAPVCGGTLDLLEPQPHLLASAVAARDAAGVRGDAFAHGVEDHAFAADAAYDVIWMQWVSIYVADVALLRFLRAAGVALRARGGVLVIKDNISAFADAVFLDRAGGGNSHIIRSAAYLCAIAELAGGLRLLVDKPQVVWPDDHFPVRFLAFSASAEGEEGRRGGEVEETPGQVAEREL